MTPRHTTTYLVLIRRVGEDELASVPMINRTFRASPTDDVVERARELLARALGVQPDSFSVEVTRVDLVPAQRSAA